jgi:5'-nucleotidase
MSQVIGPVQEGQTQFAAALACATGVVRQLLQAGWPQGVLMNVNFPACSPDAIQGVRITQQGQRELGQLKIDQRLDARGFPYYWLGFGRAAAKPGDESDLLAVQENYISITPLHLDLTHESTRAALKQVFEK